MLTYFANGRRTNADCLCYDHQYQIAIYGISSDEKPLHVPNATTFFEMDTSKVFIFDKETQTWYEL